MNSGSEEKCLAVDLSYIIRQLKSFNLSRGEWKKYFEDISISKSRLGIKHKPLKYKTSPVKTTVYLPYTRISTMKPRANSDNDSMAFCGET